MDTKTAYKLAKKSVWKYLWSILLSYLFLGAGLSLIITEINSPYSTIGIIGIILIGLAIMFLIISLFAEKTYSLLGYKLGIERIKKGN